jgi:hypothetical protein
MPRDDSIARAASKKAAVFRADLMADLPSLRGIVKASFNAYRNGLSTAVRVLIKSVKGCSF